MKIVLDNNILFSIIKPSSMASKIFFFINAEFFAPDFIELEFKKHKSECILKSGLSKIEFEKQYNKTKKKINLIEFLKYKKFLKKANKELSDPKDSPYLASALLLNSIIWSNDKHMKEQSTVKVFTTKEIIEILF